MPQGHADPRLGTDRTLVWHKAGRLEAVDTATLIGMLRGFELVVLNGCKSRELGEALAKAGVSNVVCVATLVHDEAARRFAVGFWRCVVARATSSATLRYAFLRPKPHMEGALVSCSLPSISSGI